MQSKSVLGGQRGVSLVECCIVLVLLSVLAGTAGPSLLEITKKQFLDGIASELAADLQFARGASASHQDGVRVSVYGGTGGSCVVVHTGPVASCGCGVDGIPQCATGSHLLKGQYFDIGRGVTVSANVSSIRFEPTRGMATPTGTIRLVAHGGQEVHHIVNILGRVRSCSPSAKAAGYRAC